MSGLVMLEHSKPAK